MARKTDLKRAQLREKLIDVSEARIAADGVMALKARDVAKEAGCALGAIYTHFDDMQSLVMAVNGRTFRRMGVHVTDAITAARSVDPVETVIVMSHAYLQFAAENTQLWRALFDLEMSVESQVPDWYLAELADLFQIIATPLAQMSPDKTVEEIDMQVRTLFSSVHGIVLLGLEKRISAVPMPMIEVMISDLIRRYAT